MLHEMLINTIDLIITAIITIKVKFYDITNVKQIKLVTDAAMQVKLQKFRHKHFITSNIP